MRWLAALLLATSVWAQEAPLDVGQKKMAAEEFQGAVEAYGKAIEGAPGDARGYIGRARALQMLDEDAAAVKDLSKAIELVPSPGAQIFVLRASSYWRLDDYESSISDCTTAIGVDPRFEPAYRIRGGAFSMKREHAAALRDYDKALELKPRLGTWKCRGYARAALRDFKGAAEDFTRMTELAPESPEGFAIRGRAELCLEDYKSALRDFETAFHNEDPKEPERALHVECARARLALGQKEEAEAEAAKAVEAPAKADAFAELGLYYYDTERPKEAAADLSRAVQMDPKGQDDARLFLFLARAKLGERKEAAAEAKAYLDGREKKGDWYSHVASFLSGRSKEGELFAAATSENPETAVKQECDASWYAGSVRLLDGDMAGARALFERCIATDLRDAWEYRSAKAALAGMK